MLAAADPGDLSHGASRSGRRATLAFTEMALDIIGRDEELAVLNAFIRRDDEGLLALVLEGAAGIGKSTLWLAGINTAREQRLRVLSARPAEAEKGLPYAGLGDLLHDVLDDVLPELPRPRRSALEVALLLEDSPWDVDPRAVAVAMRSVLDVLVAEAPVLLAVDDVQWLDPSSVAALSFALRRVGTQPVRLLLARRLGEEPPSVELEQRIGSDGIDRQRLESLSVGATQQLLDERLARRFARGTLLRIHEASGGNPFYSLEIARALGDEVDPTGPLPIPETLEQLVSARLHGLPQSTRAALLLVAASGTPSLLVLARGGATDEALQPAIGVRVVALSGDSIEFTHPLLASVLYHDASAAERRRVHATLAEIVDDPIERGRHLALSAHGANGQIATAVDEAAAVARARGAPIVAAELAEHAVRLTPSDAKADRRRRMIALPRAHLRAGDVRRARTLARELVAATPPGQVRAEALVVLSHVERAAGAGYERAIALRREALREPELSVRLQAELHQWLGDMVRMTDGLAVAEAHARTALELAEELDDDALRAGALSVLAVLRFNGANPGALTLAEQAYERAVATGDVQQRRNTAFSLAHILVWSLEAERARALLQSLCAELSERDELGAAEALWYLSLVELRACRFAAAAEYAARAEQIHVQYAIDQADQMMLYPPLLVAAYLGDLDRAQELADRLRVEWTWGIVKFWRGQTAQALEHFAAAETRDGGIRDPTMNWFYGEYAAALLEVGRVDEAVDLLDRWEDDATRVRRTWALAHVMRCRGLVAAARGDLDDAQALLERAVDAHTDVADPFGRARALLALGIVRRRARQKRAAREAIEAAVQQFEALEAGGWAAKARAELGRIGGRIREEGLSAAERRVAELVAEGRTNREVAAALFLGVSTVETHLRHIYAKLGVRSRTELARSLGSPS
jgi:DNA-binding CsgD family transcriptional regulator